MPQRGTQAVRVRRGSHSIVVRPAEGGAPLQELTVDLEREGVYILNVLKAETYYRGTVKYGGLHLPFGGNRAEPEKVQGPWLDVTKVDFLFQQPPKSITIRVPKGTVAGITSESRSYLTRGSPPRLD